MGWEGEGGCGSPASYIKSESKQLSPGLRQLLVGIVVETCIPGMQAEKGLQEEALSIVASVAAIPVPHLSSTQAKADTSCRAPHGCCVLEATRRHLQNLEVRFL